MARQADLFPQMAADAVPRPRWLHQLHAAAEASDNFAGVALHAGDPLSHESAVDLNTHVCFR